jgi:RNA polymerase sigma factor (sigma-70 family)
MESLPDEELISRYFAQAPSPAAQRCLNELFQRYYSRVALWCLRITGDRESAADLAQEVFIKVFRSLDSYRGESKFSTWLYSITRNHCYNEIKGRAAAPEQIGDAVLADLVDQSPNQQSQLERESGARVVRELCRESLTELETQVMTLHYAEEVPLDAVTRLLNLENSSGAKAYIVSAKRKLGRAIERWKAREQRAHL